MYLKQVESYISESCDNVVTTDLGPRTPLVCSTLMCRPAPGLKLSSLWAIEVTADSTNTVWTIIVCYDIYCLYYSCMCLESFCFYCV